MILIDYLYSKNKNVIQLALSDRDYFIHGNNIGNSLLLICSNSKIQSKIFNSSNYWHMNEYGLILNDAYYSGMCDLKNLVQYLLTLDKNIILNTVFYKDNNRYHDFLTTCSYYKLYYYIFDTNIVYSNELKHVLIPYGFVQKDLY